MDWTNIVFDLYGTLLVYGDMRRAWGDWLGALHAGLLGAGECVSREDLGVACSGMFSKAEPVVEGEGLTVYEKRLWGACQSLGIDLGGEVVGRLATDTAAAWQEHITADPQALPVLEKLGRSHRLGLVTNYDHPPHVRAVLEETGLGTCFESVVISGAVGLKKPDPEILRVALRELGGAADESAYVGDSDEDVDAALAAGMMSIRIVRPDAPPKGLKGDFARPETQSACTGETREDPTLELSVASLDQLPELVGADS